MAIALAAFSYSRIVMNNETRAKASATIAKSAHSGLKCKKISMRILRHMAATPRMSKTATIGHTIHDTRISAILSTHRVRKLAIPHPCVDNGRVALSAFNRSENGLYQPIYQSMIAATA